MYSYKERNMVKELCEFIEKVKEFVKRVESDPWSQTYKTLCETMSAFYGYTRQYDEALELERKILYINKTLIGEAAVETINSYKRTGMLEYKLGDKEAYFKLTKFSNTLSESGEKQ